MVSRRRDDAGLSLTELVVVVGLLGVVIGVVFAAMNVLTRAASSTTADGLGVSGFTNTMELVSKTVMGSRVLYAGDQRIVILTTMDDGSHQVQSVYAAPAATPTATAGMLVWERWSSDASGSTAIGGLHSVWVMSDVDANLSASPPVSLFTYFADATDASQLVTKQSDVDTSATAFTGTLPGGYAVATIGRVRLRVAVQGASGVSVDQRDVVLRVKGGS